MFSKLWLVRWFGLPSAKLFRWRLDTPGRFVPFVYSTIWAVVVSGISNKLFLFSCDVWVFFGCSGIEDLFGVRGCGAIGAGFKREQREEGRLAELQGGEE
ncbi:MAG: hypothetical protein IPN40_06045 [Uliginosibacterium sp.]|nr:hypothetical protein [Uliginosibacterium sp.]